MLVLKIIGGILAWLAGVWLVGKAIDSAYDRPDSHKPSKNKRKKNQENNSHYFENKKTYLCILKNYNYE